ncbi:MAG TPA: TIGR00341 family protein, partial [Desulfobacterales bacterium]|nr:TIGR00341 family protein [Desulfobacterales bacterium]
MKVNFKIKVPYERVVTVYEDIERGSKPELRFYAMVGASTAIAAFGLIMNSTAVVIGAMLVAPLMTPIFGIALALVRGDASLLGRAIRAEIVGVILTVSLAACFGLVIPELEVTQEMLSRTSPNLLDLLVAVFAGFAGAYAMVDEHISPALPGVAIATAIVPPLANSGLCLALGAYYGAMGSFLLFFANFLSILLVASAIFFASGMAHEFESITKKDV